MRVRTISASAVLLLAALTGCGDSGSGDEPAAKQPTKTAVSKEPNDGDGGGVEKALKLGEPAQTIGDGGTGVLQITPDTVVYVKESSGEKAANGTFAVITMQVKAMTGAPAAQTAPITGDGWKWIAPDGEAIGFDSGNSTMISLGKYSSGGAVQPGTYEWDSQVFDLTAAQAKGGTLLYTDGDGTAYRWKMPAAGSGPHVAEVKKQLAE
ncbi:hypothetical protein [Streptomyces sp. MZ04]|uniref:hypothetical protein n=1 Tax=Streptomyces sp. MZ04 TaxID=2559236 RepID=UPI00107EB24C|nr:hypothetical protein [Streptomyces sp. MZ04]TGB13828.1 hypothetical protein E2651_07750 [Streptomyces sp. MZ04]